MAKPTRTLKEIEESVAKHDGRLQDLTTQGLYLKGDKLAKREGYKQTGGLDAVHLYLIQKYGWTPSMVKGMSHSDLDFCLSEEKL